MRERRGGIASAAFRFQESACECCFCAPGGSGIDSVPETVLHYVVEIDPTTDKSWGKYVLPITSACQHASRHTSTHASKQTSVLSECIVFVRTGDLGTEETGQRLRTFVAS